MAPEELTKPKNHLHPLRFSKKRTILEMSDEQIAIMASNIVRGAEESVRHELLLIEEARLLSLVRSSSKYSPEA